MNNNIIGKIHSFETCGTVDGPGIRFVVFCQGCLLRCRYCHNPDTWDIRQGKEVSVEYLITELKKYQSYIHASGGGITASGGEPLLQPLFLEALFKKAQLHGFHTALDTSGHVTIDKAEKVLQYTDLVLLDIKAFNEKIFAQVTGGCFDITLRFLQHLHAIQKPVWIRYVYVPGLTDNIKMIQELANFLEPMQNIRRVEILPFHKMGEYKWNNLGISYTLTETPIPTEDEIQRIIKIFSASKLHVT